MNNFDEENNYDFLEKGNEIKRLEEEIQNLKLLVEFYKKKNDESIKF